MKGKTNNPNGRPAGTPNKITREARELIGQALKKGLESFEEDLATLEPKDRLNILAKFAAFIIPRPQQEPSEAEEVERKLPPWMIMEKKAIENWKS